MASSCYPISKEFFPLNRFGAPTTQKMIAERAGYMTQMFK